MKDGLGGGADMLLERPILVGRVLPWQDFLGDEARERRRFQDAPGKAHPAQQRRHVIRMREIISSEYRQIGGIARAQSDRAARFAFEQIGLHGHAVNLRRLLLGLAANERHEVKLHVRPAVAVEIEEATAFDDVRGQEPAAEEHPLQEVAQALGALFVAQQSHRLLEPPPYRGRNMILEIRADFLRIGNDGDAMRLQMRRRADPRQHEEFRAAEGSGG